MKTIDAYRILESLAVQQWCSAFAGDQEAAKRIQRRMYRVHLALDKRIEAGDRALAIIKEISEYEIYGITTGKKIITQASEELERRR